MRALGKGYHKFLINLVFLLILLASGSGNPKSISFAKGSVGDVIAFEHSEGEKFDVEVVNPYYSVEHFTASDGTPLSVDIISGPPNPPAEYETERMNSIESTIDAVILPNFPSYSWVFGCSAVSGSMIAAYYDRGSFTNIYAGPTNGGVMPVTDTSWPSWSDGYTNYPNNPLIASHNGVDGRSTRGSIDDYWVKYQSSENDPYITQGWVQHGWGTAIGDYMKTSQSAAPYNNTDGSTKFYNYTSSSSRLTCSTMESEGIASVDGTYGRKLFYQARGYSVSDCYNQKTDNTISGGFSLLNFQAEINAGNPVLLNLAGHSIVGYGYNGSTIYIRDTWDSNPDHPYTMTWGGNYQGLGLLSVSVVHPVLPHPITLSFMPLMTKNKLPNQNPSDILLSNSTIVENLPINTVVGNLTTVDANPGDTFSYSLVSGSGDSGNGSFNIAGNQLRTSKVFDYNSQNSYSIRLRTTDQGGLFFEKVFTITITKSAQDPILNGDFEQGPVSWVEYSSGGWDLIVQDFPTGVTPHNGTWAVWLGGAYDETSYIQQQVTIPTNLPYLSYWHWIGSQDTCGYDFGKVLINGTVVETYDLCTQNNTNGWVQKVVNLSSYAGSNVTIEIRAETDSALNSNLFVDQVALQASAEYLPPSSPASPDVDATVTKTDIFTLP
jgi:hypothetical protein